MNSEMRRAILSIPFICIAFWSCSSSASKNRPTIYQAGDKATVGSLVYNITDAERTQQLGEDGPAARTSKDRFYLIRVSVSNSAADEAPIPAMTLVNESGQSYPELSDGAGIPNWLGVVRKVGPAQTESGYVAFDAPITHYRLRLTDPFDEKEVAIDIPLGFVRDGKIAPATPAPGSPSPADTPLQLPKK